MKILAALICTVIFSAVGSTDAAAQDLCRGTFSNLRFNADSGDLSGVEIKIVGTRGGKQATVQISEGEPGRLIATPVLCKGTYVSLTLPKDAGRASASFTGVVSASRLVGEFVFDTGARDKVVLARRKSYWDKTK